MFCFGPQSTSSAQRHAVSSGPSFGSNVDAANPQEDVTPSGVQVHGQSETSVAAAGPYVVEAWNDGTGFFAPCPSPMNKEELIGFGFSNDGGKTFTDLGGLPNAQNPDRFTVRIRDVPARTVAYIRVLNPYRGNAVARATQRLVTWAERHALADGQWLGYQWDNPEITALADCRYHVAVEAERFVPSGEIGRFRFPPMKVAQVEVRGGIDLELRALKWLYGTWLPRSGYVPDDQPGFEVWMGRPFAHGTDYFELYAQLPIKRA